VLRPNHPLVRFQRRNGRLEQVLVGPAAVRLILGLAAMIITAVLLHTGTLRTDELAPILSAVLSTLFGP
jgi:hypothetical protein